MGKCHNCKFIQPEFYNVSRCKALWSLDKSDGIIRKIYPLVSDVRVDGGCDYYKPNWFMKLKLKIGGIQGCWYSMKFPEKTI